MALLKSRQVAQKLPVMTADRASDLIVSFGDYTVTGAEVSGDVVEMVPLPAGYVPVDLIVDNTALGATATTGVGILSGDFDSIAPRTCGAQFMAAQAMQTAGIKRMAVAGGGRIAPTTNVRGIGFSLDTVATPTAGATVRLTLLCRPAVEAA